MADQERQSASSVESPVCPEPQLEVSQDLELLAQEIAEAAVEEEEEEDGEDSEEEDDDEEEELEEEEDEVDETETLQLASPSETHSPTPQDSDTNAPEIVDMVTEEGKPRSNSPVDETSWVLVDAEEDDGRATEPSEEHPELKYTLLRKFLVAGDFRQKLTDAGFACDEESNEEGEGINMVMSCSESMVICDMPQNDGDEDTPSLQLKNLPDCNKKSAWRGTFAGARVEVEVERKGGIQVAAVRIWQVDLLSALSSLQSLVSTAGLVSYADVDVTSLLARAA